MKKTRRTAQQGATLVEAGITAIAFLFLVFGIIDMGRAYNIFQNATDAAREGARYAVAPDPTTGALPSSDAVIAHVTPFLESNNLTVTSGMITVASTTHTVNGVSTTYTNVTVSPTYYFFFLKVGGITMSASSEMRNETN